MPGRAAARPLTNSDLLRGKITLGASLLTPTLDAFWDHPRLAQLFPAFLTAIYGSVSATIPLMEAAARVSSRLAKSERVAAALPAYFLQHIEEERDHDEWLLRDLEAIGISRAGVLGRLPDPHISAMVGSQYYWIFHSHPIALLGFFAVLEGNPPALEHLADVQSRTGLPSDAFRMLRHHAEADAEHASELYAFIDSLPLSTRHVELLGRSALSTLGFLNEFFGSFATDGA